MWTFSSSFANQVMQYTSRPDHGTATQVALRHASGSLEDLLSGGLAKNVAKPCFRALTYLGEGSVGNITVERVQWNFVENGGSKTTEILAFDARGFLRAANIEYSDNNDTFRQAETFTNLQTNSTIAPQTFALALPQGARLLTAEQMQTEMMRGYGMMDAAPAKNRATN